MTTTGTFATHGSGIIVPSHRADNTQSSPGFVVPTKPGYYPISEPGVAQWQTMVRGVPETGVPVAYLAFQVVYPSDGDDQCELAILEYKFGAVLARTGLQSGLLNSAGDKVVTLTSTFVLQRGQPYYFAFGYGPITGTYPATLICANYPGGPNVVGFGGPGYGYANALDQAAGSDGSVQAESAAVNNGVGVMIWVRDW